MTLEPGTARIVAVDALGNARTNPSTGGGTIEALRAIAAAVLDLADAIRETRDGPS